MSATTPATTRLEFAIERSQQVVPAERRAEILAAPGFGKFFTDHMFTATWTSDRGWDDAAVRPYGPFQVDPASAVLHYAQEIFEGMKAYRHADGSIWTFRPWANGERFARSAHRLALPQLPVDDFVASIDALVQVDQAWVPGGGEASLYLRPFMFASEVFLGVRPARQVTYCVIASPAGAYFASGVKPVSIWLSDNYTRAARGGMGAAKTGGNYAASLLPQQEALEHGCDQVCFLDAIEGRWVEELGGMNLFFVLRRRADRDAGARHHPRGRDTFVDPADRGRLRPQGGGAPVRHPGVARRRAQPDASPRCSPAAPPLWSRRSAVSSGATVRLAPGDEVGPVTTAIRDTLLDIQYGRVEDTHGHLHRVL